MGKRKPTKQAGGYKVVVKPDKVDSAESDIRIGKAFGCVFEEIFKWRKRKRDNNK